MSRSRGVRKRNLRGFEVQLGVGGETIGPERQRNGGRANAASLYQKVPTGCAKLGLV